MRKDKIIVAGLFALGFAVLGAFYLSTTNGVAAQDYEAQDTGGPYLVIEVAGEDPRGALGEIVIDLRDDVAPAHAERLIALAEAGDYDGVVFHRVIEGFMAQTGDVRHGRHGSSLAGVGTGGSDMPDLQAEFSGLPFERGVVGMARSFDPNSANSQFFIMFDAMPSLNGDYTVVGQVVEGIEVVDAILRGDPARNGAVDAPDRMERVTVRR